MARTDPIPEEIRAAVVRLHSQGKGCNQIARELKIAAASVSKIARRAGLAFDRTATELATRARTIDLAEMRTTLLRKMAVASSEMLDELDGPYLVYSFGGRENTYEEHLLDTPPVEVRRSAITTAGLTVDRVSRYLDNRPDGNLAEVDSMLDRLEAHMEADAERHADEYAEFDAEMKAYL